MTYTPGTDGTPWCHSIINGELFQGCVARASENSPHASGWSVQPYLKEDIGGSPGVRGGGRERGRQRPWGTRGA